MDYYWLTLAMAPQAAELMAGTYRALGIGTGVGKTLEIQYPYKQQWFEGDRVLRLIPDETPERIAVEVQNEKGSFSAMLKKNPEFADPDTYVIDNVGGVTLNIDFKNKVVTMAHNVPTEQSSVMLQLDYRKGAQHDIGYS